MPSSERLLHQAPLPHNNINAPVMLMTLVSMPYQSTALLQDIVPQYHVDEV